MSIIQLLFSGKGRLNRKPFWLIWLPLVVISATMQPLFENKSGFDSLTWVIFILPLALLVIWLWFAISIKRLHDVNFDGRWLLLGLIPLIGTIGLLIVAARPGNVGANRFGPDPLEGLRRDALPQSSA